MTKEVLLISTKDVIAEEFGPVGVANTEKAAIRQFEYQMMKMVESPSIRADYELYEIACFDIETGVVTVTASHPILLKRGSDYLPKDSKVETRKMCGPLGAAYE